MAEEVEAVASQARSPVAVLLAGNGVAAAVGGCAHAQAEGVGQADEGHAFAPLLRSFWRQRKWGASRLKPRPFRF